MIVKDSFVNCGWLSIGWTEVHNEEKIKQLFGMLAEGVLQMLLGSIEYDGKCLFRNNFFLSSDLLLILHHWSIQNKSLS
jgi:hypothetical protein